MVKMGLGCQLNLLSEKERKMTGKTIVITTVPSSRTAGALGKVAIRRSPLAATLTSPQQQPRKNLGIQKTLAPISRSIVIPNTRSIRALSPVTVPESTSSSSASLSGAKRLAAPPVVDMEKVKEEPLYVFHPPPRKRERLTHLTTEEKQHRRKMKNRIAAQTARDRKKAKMGGLEENVRYLAHQNETLLAENTKLKERAKNLCAENNHLKAEMGKMEKKCKELELAMVESSAKAIGSAASINAPQQQEQVKAATRWALLWTVLTMLFLKESSGTFSKGAKLSKFQHRLEMRSKILQRMENMSEKQRNPYVKNLLLHWKKVEQQPP